MFTSNHSIVYFHDDFSSDYNQVYDICTNVDANLFDCKSLDHLYYIINNFKPMYIILDAQNSINNALIDEIININSKCITFIITSKDIDVINSNIYIVNDFKILNKLILNHYKFYSRHMVLPKVDSKTCYSFLLNELNNLAFRPKLIGYKYIVELIYELYSCSPASNYKCNDLYNLISHKYNTNSACIERAIRFSILNAYKNCENKKIFLDISKTYKVPTIKEITNYILDKMILALTS